MLGLVLKAEGRIEKKSQCCDAVLTWIGGESISAKHHWDGIKNKWWYLREVRWDQQKNSLPSKDRCLPDRVAQETLRFLVQTWDLSSKQESLSWVLDRWTSLVLLRLRFQIQHIRSSSSLNRHLECHQPWLRVDPLPQLSGFHLIH